MMAVPLSRFSETTIDALSRAAGGGVEVRGARLVVTPRSLDDARRVIAFAAGRGLWFGGERLVLDRSGLCYVGVVDARAMWIRCGAGAPVAAVEEALCRARLTLGSQPPSVWAGTVADWLEGPYAGRRAMDGRLEPGVASVEAVLHDGTPLATRAAPRSAAGPAVGQLILGGSGRCGVLLCATLKARPLPRQLDHLALEGDAAQLARWLHEALQQLLVPVEARIVGGRRLEVACPAAGEDEIVVLQRHRRRARELGLATSRCDPAPPPSGAEAELPAAALPGLVRAGGDVRLVRMARESVIAVGDVPASLPRAASHGDLLARVATALVGPPPGTG